MDNSYMTLGHVCMNKTKLISKIKSKSNCDKMIVEEKKCHKKIHFKYAI